MEHYVTSMVQHDEDYQLLIACRCGRLIETSVNRAMRSWLEHLEEEE